MLKYIYQGKYNGNRIALPEEETKTKNKDAIDGWPQTREGFIWRT